MKKISIIFAIVALLLFYASMVFASSGKWLLTAKKTKDSKPELTYYEKENDCKMGAKILMWPPNPYYSADCSEVGSK